MSPFEYVMVLVSIILGLGITSLLRGTVNAWTRGTDTKPGLLQSLWVASMLLAHVHLWALRWSGEPRNDWPGLVLLSFLFLPVVYYALAEFLFPPPGRAVALDEYFLDNRRRFFALNVLMALAQSVGGMVHYGDRAPLWEPLTIVPFAVFFMFSKSKRLHIAWAVLVLVGFALRLAEVSIGS